METKVYLAEHQVYNWNKIGNVVCRIGFYKLDLALIADLQGKSLANAVADFNGNFSAIIEKDDCLYLVSDKFQSFPLLYYIDDSKIMVSDSISYIESKIELTIDDDSVNEFLAMGVVTGSETLYKNLHVVEAGQIVRIDTKNGAVQKIDYYLHTHYNDYNLPIPELKEKLNNKLISVFTRIKKQLGDRMIVIPLSGGYDSRLVAEMLKKIGITNVLCFSYGNTHTKEVNVAERLAGELGFKWIYVPQSGELVEELIADTSFWPKMKQISSASAMPYLQNYILKKLINDGIVPTDAVVMTGNSGDVVEGDQMPYEFLNPSTIYNRDQLVNQIINKHFRLAGRRGGAIPEVRKKIIERYCMQESYTYDEVHDVYEKFNWRERQSQWLFNDGQYYSEYCGLEWYFPLWDDEFVDFWLHLPTQLRFQRNFYYDYVNKEKIYSANDITMRTKMLDFAKKYFYSILTKMYVNKRIKEYGGGDSLWHLLNKENFTHMVKWTKGVGTSSDTAKIWSLLINCYGIDPYKIDFSKYEEFDIK